ERARCPPGGSTSSLSRSDRDRLPVLAEDAAKDPAHLAKRRVRLDRAEEMGHQVRLGGAWASRRVAEPTERGFARLGIALATRPLEARELALQGPGWHREYGHGRLLALVDVGIDPDDAPLPGVELALVAVGRIGDLALRIALRDPWEHDAPSIDLIDVSPHLSLGL